MDTNLSRLWIIMKDRGAWCAAVHGTTKSWLSDWTTKMSKVPQSQGKFMEQFACPSFTEEKKNKMQNVYQPFISHPPGPFGWTYCLCDHASPGCRYWVKVNPWLKIGPLIAGQWPETWVDGLACKDELRPSDILWAGNQQIQQRVTNLRIYRRKEEAAHYDHV